MSDFRPPPLPAEGKTDPAIKIERLYAAHKQVEKYKLANAIKEWAKLIATASAIGAAVFGFFHAKAASRTVEEHKSATTQAIDDERHQRERDVDAIGEALKAHADEHKALDHWRGKTDQRLELLLDAARVPKAKRPAEDE
jgi:MoxR-like ATPase